MKNLLLLMLFITSFSYCTKGEIFEINGRKEPMLCHLARAMMNSQTNKFAVTHLYNYSEGKITFMGEIVEHISVARKAINEKNFIYVPSYTETTNRLSGGEIEPMAAFIVGTQDASIKELLPKPKQQKRS